MIYSLVDFTATTVKLTAGSDEFIFKKVYCTTTVKGDYVVFSSHQAETNTFRQQYAILYTDCAAPVGTSATDLKLKIDKILNNYAAGNIGRWYGAFYHDATQTNGGATTENLISFNQTFESDSISVVSSNRITVTNAGLYSVTLRAQVDKTDNVDTYADFWIKKNGTNIAASKSHFEMIHKDVTYAFTMNFLLTLADSDYIQFAWHSPNTTVRLLYEAAGATPTRPAAASAMANIFKVT